MSANNLAAGPPEAFAALVAEQPAEELLFLSRESPKVWEAKGGTIAR